MESHDGYEFEWLSFLKDGSVQAEFGKTSPEHKEIFQWQTTPSGQLVITSDFDIYAQLTLISRTSQRIVARNLQGNILKYKILNNPST